MIAACPAPPAAIYACAPTVCWVTMKAVIAVESGGDALALHDNTTGRTYRAHSQAQAVAWARWLIARGHSVDVGETQVNFFRSRFRDGVEVGVAFEPCANIRLGGEILHRDYVQAISSWSPGQWALLHALSSFHHGRLDLDRPYLARYHGPDGRSVSVDGAYHPTPVRYHFMSQAGVPVRQIALPHPAGNVPAYRLAAVNIPVR